MDCSSISHNQIPHTTALFRDFLYDYSRVQEFFPGNPFLEQNVKRYASFVDYPDPLRRDVVAVLREQNQKLCAGSETARNLDRLARAGCFAIVTGQQVGLFSGPAFAIYKALTAVKLARHLTAQGLEAVPVFWLASEDHDFAEVNHCFVQDREGHPRRLQYEGAPPTANAPVGALQITDEVLPLLQSMRETLSGTPFGAEICEVIAQYYQPGISFSAAFGALMARLFAAHGVVLVDSLDARLHRLGSGVFRTALEAAPQIVQDVIARDRQLAAAGYHAQVRVADNATTLFLYENGERTGLRTEDGRFRSSSGKEYSAGDLLARLEARPEDFSPNVLLRPVMQDTLLPTAAYVGGPAEIAYLAQATPLYKRILARQPVIFPRAGFTVLDSVASRLLGKYELSLADVWSGRQGLREKMASRFLPEGLTAAFDAAAARLREDLDTIQQGLRKLDPTLADAATNSGQKMQYQLSNLERKAAAAVQNRSDLIERDASRLENTLFPDKLLQERIYSGISLLARFGMPLLEQLYEQITLQSGDHLMVTP